MPIVGSEFCNRIEVHVKPVKLGKVIGIGPAPVQATIDEVTTLLTLPVTINGFTGIAAIACPMTTRPANHGFALPAATHSPSVWYSAGFSGNQAASAKRSSP